MFYKQKKMPFCVEPAIFGYSIAFFRLGLLRSFKAWIEKVKSTVPKATGVVGVFGAF